MIAAGLLFASALSLSLFTITATAEPDAEVVEVGEELVIEVAAMGGGLSTASVAPGTMPANLEIGAAQGPRLDRRVERVPGGRQVQVERLVWIFTVTPITAGRYVVPPFTITTGPESVKTPSIAFEARGSFDASRFVFVETRVDSRPRYVGEPISVELVTGVADEWRERLLQGETSIGATWMNEGLGSGCPAEATSLAATGGPAGSPVRTADGGSIDMRPAGVAMRAASGVTVRFNTVSATRRFIPRRAGTCTVPKTPFRAVIATQVEPEGPFGNRVFATQTKLAAVDAPPRTIEILALPEEGRPDDFAGLVGRLAMTVSAEPRRVRVGDSVRVRVDVTGEGNLASTVLPRVEVPGFKRFGVKEEIAPDASARTLLYDLAPESADVRAIPSFRIPVFDTTSKSYSTLMSPPIPIVVSAGPASAAAPAATPPPQATATRYPVTRLVLLAFAAPIVLLGIRAALKRAAPPAHRPAHRPAAASPPARPPRASPSPSFPSRPRPRLKTALSPDSLPSDPSQAFSHIAAAFTHFLSDLASTPPEHFRGVDLEAQLRPLLSDSALRARVAALIADADAAAFAGHSSPDSPDSPAVSPAALAAAALALAKSVERAVHPATSP